MRVISTHEYYALLFLDSSEIEGTIKGLQKLLEHNDYPAVQLHYSKEYDEKASGTIKRLKYLFKEELPAPVTRMTPVWEEGKKNVDK